MTGSSTNGSEEEISEDRFLKLWFLQPRGKTQRPSFYRSSSLSLSLAENPAGNVAISQRRGSVTVFGRLGHQAFITSVGPVSAD